jgi:hypothetical protein
VAEDPVFLFRTTHPYGHGGGAALARESDDLFQFLWAVFESEWGRVGFDDDFVAGPLIDDFAGDSDGNFSATE